MARPRKFAEATVKIGIILPVSTAEKLDSMGRTRSEVVCELIDNAQVVSTVCVRPEPPKFPPLPHGFRGQREKTGHPEFNPPIDGRYYLRRPKPQDGGQK